MNTNVVEIVKWKSASGVTDRATIDAAQALVPDLKTVGGFIEKTLYVQSRVIISPVEAGHCSEPGM